MKNILYQMFLTFVRPLLHGVGLDLVWRATTSTEASWPKIIHYADTVRRSYVGNTLEPKRNVIWQFWWQGAENAPPLIRACLTSVRKWANGLEVIVIDKANLSRYVDMPDFILHQHLNGNMTTTHLSDYIRARLLSRYGGIWVDASVYFTAPIPQEIRDAPFFMFKSSLWAHEANIPSENLFLQTIHVASNNALGGGSSAGSSWFLSSDKNCRLLDLTAQCMEEYWKNENSLCDYYLFHKFITYLACVDPMCRCEFVSSPTYLNINPHLLQFSLSEPLDETLLKNFKAATPIHKLTYKFSTPVPPGSFRQAIEDAGI